ncbi:hypothetical protein L226DRAFT_118668 [Lentinus tigrinus ALCF2SS1-7]|uniref:Uncharacterized protein n=1 Tax=Lentinus tigrinus ALCF2SS1-6 TaxID=1328759 RepID=A0A5C2STR9_9APHY|nr:hypothetical protein L227DRAFT_4094 [Lentinus tigrinus ALCF2SS1-6]RPD80731.1 hypothetical protein L226DRAFT_118668 [Lentinus tigrinus ALCF2SS1-7]
MVQLRTNLTVARAEVASLTTELSAQEAVVASITTQLAEQEAETAMANQEIDELREQADQGNQALHGIVDQANKKIHRRNAEVSRLWAFLQVRLAEVDGLRWELGLWHDEAAQLKKALEVFQPPTPPSDSASMEEVEPASDLPTIVVQSPSSEWVREEKQKINKSLLRAPKRNTRTKSKLPKKKGSKSVSAPSTSTSLSSPSPSTSPSSSSSSANLPAAQPELSSPLITSNNVTPSPCLEEATSPTTPPSLTTIALPVDETIPQCLVVDQITPTPSSTDDELRLTSSPRHEDSILPSRAHDQSMPSPQPVHDATFPISLSRIDNTIPPVSVKPMNSHISALKADSKAFWAPKRSLTISLRLRRNPLGSISGNAPRHSRFRNQNQDQNSLKLADITCEVDEGSWTMVSID